MSETTAATAPVVTVVATDADDPGTSNNGVIAYSISGKGILLKSIGQFQ